MLSLINNFVLSKDSLFGKEKNSPCLISSSILLFTSFYEKVKFTFFYISMQKNKCNMNYLRGTSAYLQLANVDEE